MPHLVLDIQRSVAVMMAVGVFIMVKPAESWGGVTFYTNEEAFYAVEPGLPVQSFDSANLFNQTFVTQSNYLNSATSNLVFAAGSILPSLTISTLSPTYQNQALIVDGDGPVGAISVGNYTFGDTLVLTFSPGVLAVGEDLFANTGYGTSFAGNNTETVFSGTTLLGSITVSNAVGGYDFIGAVSTNQPITSVQFTWDGDGDGITFVSNIRFGTHVPDAALVANGTGGLTLLWPATGGYTLLQTTNLADGNWTTNHSAVTTSNGTNSLVITPSAGNMFFRMSYP